MLTQEQYAHQLGEIKRKRAMADVLKQRAITPQGNMQNYSPIQALAQVLSAAVASGKDSSLNKKESALIDKQAEDQRAESARILQAFQGSPAKEAIPFQDEAGAAFEDTTDIPGFQSQPQGLLAQEAAPAVPGGQNAMIAAMLSSQSPDYQKMAMEMMSKQKSPQWKLGEIGAPGDRRQSVFYNESDPTQTRPVGDAFRKNQVPDWMLPGYIETKRKVAEAESKEKTLSPTAQKELFEADETSQASDNVIQMLNEAKAINEKAYSGPFATTRAKAVSLVPGGTEAADATINLDNIMTSQALESLKATFGGMPTEGERKILLDMQASADKTPKQRVEIMDRAIEAAKRRKAFNEEKAKSLRSGSYFKEPPQSPQKSGGIKFLGFE